MEKIIIKTYLEFLNEASEPYTDLAGSFIDSDYTPNWKDTPQRLANKASNKKLKVLRYIYDAGEEGRSYTEIQRFYYELEGKTRDRDEYTEKPGGGWDSETVNREYNSTKDRGIGATMLSGGDYRGLQTGILHAFCTKNDKGKWILSDRKLISIFNFTDAGDEDDMKLVRDLGLFD